MSAVKLYIMTGENDPHSHASLLIPQPSEHDIGGTKLTPIAMSDGNNEDQWTEQESRRFKEFEQKLDEWTALLPADLIERGGENAENEVRTKIKLATERMMAAKSEIFDTISGGFLDEAGTTDEYKDRLLQIVKMVEGTIAVVQGVFFDNGWSGDALRRYEEFSDSFMAFMDDPNNSTAAVDSKNSPREYAFIVQLNHIFRNFLSCDSMDSLRDDCANLKFEGTDSLQILRTISFLLDRVTDENLGEFRGTHAGLIQQIEPSFSKIERFLLKDVLRSYDKLSANGKRLGYLARNKSLVIEAFCQQKELRPIDSETDVIFGIYPKTFSDMMEG